ncbi:GntR family transcriptional regulator [Pararhodobacter sp. SW119]|uniref:RraA family protein n=1 Tax=Pararhodobacter sp. SW119 TaxID=2780075 RepID=UPI001AE07451|nr:GntR family transcriptional regulator [Pararhodobacter sp. SW119]
MEPYHSALVQLRAMLALREFAPNTRLPAERELAEMIDTTRGELRPTDGRQTPVFRRSLPLSRPHHLGPVGCDGRLGIAGAVEGLSPIDPEADIAGQAFTFAHLPAGVAGETVGEFLDDLGPGDVVVIDYRGRTDRTVWGNIMTEVTKARGIEGTVINGVNREPQESPAIDYPIWSMRGHMHTGKDRVVLQPTNVPVALGHVRLKPSDVISADGNGVVVVPLPRAMEVLSTVEAVETTENAILATVREGVALDEARKPHGYQALQTRQK